MHWEYRGNCICNEKSKKHSLQIKFHFLFVLRRLFVVRVLFNYSMCLSVCFCLRVCTVYDHCNLSRLLEISYIFIYTFSSLRNSFLSLKYPSNRTNFIIYAFESFLRSIHYQCRSALFILLTYLFDRFLFLCFLFFWFRNEMKWFGMIRNKNLICFAISTRFSAFTETTYIYWCVLLRSINRWHQLYRFLQLCSNHDWIYSLFIYAKERKMKWWNKNPKFRWDCSNSTMLNAHLCLSIVFWYIADGKFEIETHQLIFSFIKSNWNIVRFLSIDHKTLLIRLRKINLFDFWYCCRHILIALRTMPPGELLLVPPHCIPLLLSQATILPPTLYPPPMAPLFMFIESVPHQPIDVNAIGNR